MLLKAILCVQHFCSFGALLLILNLNSCRTSECRNLAWRLYTFYDFISSSHHLNLLATLRVLRNYLKVKAES